MSIAPAVSSLRLAELAHRRKPGHSLESAFYTDREVFDLDVAAIFAKHWIFVAAEAEVREPGDFVTVEIGSYSLIVLRDDDGDVNAMHNVCRHRGTRLLNEDRGSVGNLVCGYHQWTYSTNGALLHAGQQAKGFDPACFSLKRVPVRRVAGLIFVCVAQQPPADFDDVAARVAPYLAPHGLDRTKVAAQTETVEHANWKLVMENNRECYHCEASHPELTCVFFPTYGYAEEEIPARLLPAHARYLKAESQLQQRCTERAIPFAAIEELHGRASGFRVQREALDGAGESYTPDGSAASRKLLADLDVAKLGRLSFHLQPNAWFHVLGDHAVTFSIVPLDVNRTLLRTTWLTHEDAQEGVDYDVDTLTDVWAKTNEQDAVLVARAQAGVTSPAYEPGPYAPSEYQVDAFVTWYVERVKEYLDDD